MGRIVLNVRFLGEAFLSGVFADSDGGLWDLAEEFFEFFFLGID